MARETDAVLAFLRRIGEPVSGPTSREERRELQAAIEDRALSRADALRIAMATATKVRFDYHRKRDDQHLEYTGAVYEVGTHPASGRPVMWATDHKHGGGQIHAFLLSRVSNVQNRMLANFRPHWPTQPESV
jgi:hypothetical protein